MEELQEYTAKIKNNIEYLINNNLLKEAKEIINEYEKIAKQDSDIYSFRGIIALLENDEELALMYFRSGIKICGENFDLNYNLGYLYECVKKNNEAYKYYLRALQFSGEEHKVHINEKLREFEEKINLNSDSIEKSEVALKVSIITLAYNVKPYIKECIDSVINQSMKDFEWIILDNGCTDGTSEILEEYSKKDTRIKLYKNERNSFVYKQKHNFDYVNHINNFKSEYICYLDSDDYLDCNFLKDLYEEAKKNNSDICACGVEMFNNEDRNIKVYRTPPRLNVKDIKELGHGKVFSEIYGCFRPMWGKLIKSNIAIEARESIRLNNIQTGNGGDTMFSLHYLEKSNSASFIDKQLYYYRVRNNSSFNTDINHKRYLDYFKIYFKTKEILERWDMLDSLNNYFISSVLFQSIKDCIDVSINSKNVDNKKRIQVITEIISNDELRTILNNNGLLITIIDYSIRAINNIMEIQ